jgi:hypothetical protein
MDLRLVWQLYASHAQRGANEDAGLLAPTDLDEVDIDLYGDAKVACELACRSGGDSSVLIARSGLIGGPGDPSDRAGYWVARAARDPLTPMLVPGSPAAVTQVIDVRDLAAWLSDCAENRTMGIYDAVGPMVALDEWIELSREIGGHTGPLGPASDGCLAAEGVEEFMGPESLPLWLADPEWQGSAPAVAMRQRRPAWRTGPSATQSPTSWPGSGCRDWIVHASQECRPNAKQRCSQNSPAPEDVWPQDAPPPPAQSTLSTPDTRYRCRDGCGSRRRYRVRGKAVATARPDRTIAIPSLRYRRRYTSRRWPIATTRTRCASSSSS